MNFSDKIKYQREQNHLTQKELAELVGVSQRAIAAYESSGTIARISTMRKLAHALNVSYDYLKHDEITDVESVAVYNEEKDEVTIFAVNRNLQEDVELTTDVRSFAGYHIKEHIVMENDDLKAANTVTEQNVYPVNAEDRSRLDDGVVTSVLKKASWNVIRLGK